MLYKFLDDSDGYEPFVKAERHRSQTVIVAATKNPVGALATAKQAGMIIGSGYGKFKDSQIRIANFPAVSADQVQALLSVLKE